MKRRKLKAILYNQSYPASPPLREWRMELWKKGIEESGDAAEMLSSDPDQFGDVCITWGPRTTAQAHLKGMHHIIMECGFLGDRLNNFYVGYSGLNGFGVCPTIVRKNAGEEWYPLLKPLPKRKGHAHAAIFGQVAKDASLIPLCADDEKRPAAYAAWLRNLAAYLERKGLAVGFRGHPSDPVWTNQVRPPVFSFDEAGWDKSRIAEWSDVAVAFSSNALVEAYMEGVDVIPAHPTSLCWDVRSAVDEQQWRTDAQRREWLDMVASCQWSAVQIESGEAWRSIRDHFARSCKL